ncbi:MAG TPA: gamma carbonic anhydrase family protein [Thermomicrobiales bacterium]|nr:gamma carbonic anhydrase family protein [Thermomicrobiales bacterium]
MLLALGDKRPRVAPDAYIAPTATLIGDVTVEAGASVWFGAVLRGDTEPIRVGPRSNVQDNAVLHADLGFPTTIGAGVTIGHGAIVHGATLEDNVLIGMGAVLLNGSHIATESLVGAMALVTEGKTFPRRSLLLGAPAKVARELDDAAVAGIYDSAAGYAARAQRYRGMTNDE